MFLSPNATLNQRRWGLPRQIRVMIFESLRHNDFWYSKNLFQTTNRNIHSKVFWNFILTGSFDIQVIIIR